MRQPASPLPVTLVIDTVRDRLALALALPDGSVVDQSEAVARGHAEIVMDRIASLLAKAGYAYDDLQRVAALSGPGSFTGLRIGLSVARGLGLALSIPVLGLPTLHALSLTVPQGGIIALDARRGEAFLQRFSGPATPLDALALVSADAALAARGGAGFVSDPPDIAALARFAQAAEPAAWPPEPCYARGADARPQARAGIALA